MISEDISSNMVIWKKKIIADSEMYMSLLPFDETNEEEVDFFTSNISQLDPEAAKQTEKDDTRAIIFRNSGNEQFKIFKWMEAMELYNKSLRFAIVGSENISLAYANRSSCFLRMGKYDECLADIRLAKKANYPKHLMPKLVARQNECRLRMKLCCVGCEAESKWEPSLDYELDEQFPYMANALKFQCNEEFGRHIVAKQDLEVGQVILKEEAFHFNAASCGITCCKTCLKHTKNFIPCSNCTHVMFCDEKCMDSNEIHKIACNASYLRTPVNIQIIESILIAVNTFSSIDELMDFVEIALATHDVVDSPKCDTFEQTRYALFLKLWSPSAVMDKNRLNEICIIILIIYLMIMHIPEIKQRFDTKPKRRFLQHLIWHHIKIIDANGIQYAGKFANIGETVSIEFMSIFSSFINHSCIPNIMFARHGNIFYGYVARPIGEGEQLFTTYVDENYQKDQRHSDLREKYQFECNCSKCEPCFKEEDRKRIQSDPDFEYIAQIDVVKIENKWTRPEINDKCCNLLHQYGHLPWTEEIDLIMFKFKQCMDVEFSTI